MSDRRVQFDFEVEFANGGGIQGQGFRLDIDGPEIDDLQLAAYLVEDLGLLMVERVEILDKSYIDEPHKRRFVDAGEEVVVDLSHQISDGMITYPGLPGPRITTHLSREDSRAHYENGVEFHIGRVDLVANTGTYLDAPFHRYPDGDDVAALKPGDLLDLPTSVVSTSTKVISAGVFADTETWGRAVLIHTGWSANFATDRYLGDHPHLTENAARRLIEGGARLVGIDSANIDEVTGGSRPAHSLLLQAGIPIVEHLTNLERLVGATSIRFTALPPPMVGMGTFPVRAVATATFPS